VSDDVIKRDQCFDWFKLQPSLQDGATKGAYPFFGVQGDHSILHHPQQRTDLFWAFATSLWGCGPAPTEVRIPRGPEEELKAFQEASWAFGHSLHRPDGLFDEQGDVVLSKLRANPELRPFTNMHGKNGMQFCAENFCAGNVAASIGLDIRMFSDMSSLQLDESVYTLGCRTVSAIRFGNHAGISAFPGGAIGVHGGAIQAAMDELTALCMRIWVCPATTTRKITHQISRPVYQFQTYTAECEIERFLNNGAICVIKGRLLDVLGQVVCVSSSDMVNVNVMATQQLAG